MPFHSQYGEDEALWEFFQQRKSGVCVEVGGFDGETFSNSLFFEENGWRAVIVEPIPRLAEKIRQRRPAAAVFGCAAGRAVGEIKLSIAHGIEVLSTTNPDARQMKRIERQGARVEEIIVPMRTLDDMLAEAGVAAVDFVTIDVEGGEMEVLAGFDLDRWKPRVVILENNLKSRSLLLHDEMLERDYHWFKNTGCNEWYAPGWDKSVASASRKLRNQFRSARIRLRNFSRAVTERTGVKAMERRIRHAIKGS